MLILDENLWLTEGDIDDIITLKKIDNDYQYQHKPYG
ncbi:hypothetical protein DesyoDRAFT_0561 [Desulfosporosinus youngiae DSM 17734]|uniref:Uncharacterized protein n=1 Tax=Desulfosporosinus youngiae DSM 17734 TaxID=768710 RepID=H5XSS5_9FIRM|nr:hypothetical protein DesyoDRAFT_0561 [Desulfosporosinus youngiae DSM 17734]